MNLLPLPTKKKIRIERRYLFHKNQQPEQYYIKYINGVPHQTGPDFTHITPECLNGHISRGANNKNTGIMIHTLDNGDKVTLLKVKLGNGMRGAY